MMTERQSQILNRIVKEYISRAQPVSSQLLEKKCNLNVSSATIRNEMQQLTEKGYLYQPHTSAGRAPTDKGYRFFVDSLLEKGLREFEIKLEKETKDILKFTHDLTRLMAMRSSSLALSYLAEQKLLWKEGWGEIFREPEFKKGDLASRLTHMLDELEESIDEIFSESPSQIQVYIGRENPFSKESDFGMITARCRFPHKEKGFLMIAGPKRMAYDRNIGLVDSVIKFLENC